MGVRASVTAGAACVLLAAPAILPDVARNVDRFGLGAAQVGGAVAAAADISVGRGEDGQDGEIGQAGKRGQDGKPGKAGKAGKPGRDGQDGKSANGKSGKDNTGKGRRGAACKRRCGTPDDAQERVEREKQLLRSILDEAFR